MRKWLSSSSRTIMKYRRKLLAYWKRPDFKSNKQIQLRKSQNIVQYWKLKFHIPRICDILLSDFTRQAYEEDQFFPELIDRHFSSLIDLNPNFQGIFIISYVCSQCIRNDSAKFAISRGPRQLCSWLSFHLTVRADVHNWPFRSQWMPRSERLVNTRQRNLYISARLALRMTWENRREACLVTRITMRA